jgi:hypothetical protein
VVLLVVVAVMVVVVVGRQSAVRLHLLMNRHTYIIKYGGKRRRDGGEGDGDEEEDDMEPCFPSLSFLSGFFSTGMCLYIYKYR